MNKVYHKVAVASLCTALGFALGANKEAKAATFSFAPTSEFAVVHQGDSFYWYSQRNLPVENSPSAKPGYSKESRAFYEFNLLNLFLETNTVISQANFHTDIDTIGNIDLHISGYFGNGRPDASDFYMAGFIASEQRPWIEWSEGNRTLNVDLTRFVNNVRRYNSYLNYGNGYPFVGVSISTIPYYSWVP